MKSNILKYFYIALIVIILTTLSISTYFNIDTTIQYYCAIFKQTFTIKFIYIAWGYLLAGTIIGLLINQISKSKMLQMYNAYQKRHETSSIENDNDKAKIKTLEAKIATLEAALNSALKNE